MSSDAAHIVWGQAPASRVASDERRLALVNGSRIAVLGGGPAGSLFAYFVRRLADAVDLDVHVDVFEPRSFAHTGPAGCNHCGGVVSESLVQLLAIEGINVPSAVVQRGIESYMLHTDVGDVRLGTPAHEKRIASVFRGNGPRAAAGADVAGLDAFLLQLACSVGARRVSKLVTSLRAGQDAVEVVTADGSASAYQLVAVATGINSQLLHALPSVAPEYRPPVGSRTFIAEFDLGEAAAGECLGRSMHVFLLDLPRLQFAALVPKGRFVTLCLLGKDVDEALVEQFLALPEVSRCFPQSIVPRPACHCFPRINAAPAVRPFADRVVCIGDCGITRLYKDGIGAAYRTAKAAAKTVVHHGVSAGDFQRHFWPECHGLIVDNRIARLIFGATTLIRRFRFIRRGVVRMAAMEQAAMRPDKPMSSVLWDLFTGSAPYREILMRTLRPSFGAMLTRRILGAGWHVR